MGESGSRRAHWGRSDLPTTVPTGLVDKELPHACTSDAETEVRTACANRSMTTAGSAGRHPAMIITTEAIGTTIRITLLPIIQLTSRLYIEPLKSTMQRIAKAYKPRTR
jgi:hypothetical protein